VILASRDFMDALRFDLEVTYCFVSSWNEKNHSELIAFQYFDGGVELLLNFRKPQERTRTVVVVE